MRYTVEDSDITLLNEITKKYVNIYNKNYFFYQIRCVLKVLTNTNCIQYLTIKPKPNVQYTTNPNIILKNQPFFPQLLEKRIIFTSSIRDVTHDYYIKNDYLCVNLN